MVNFSYGESFFLHISIDGEMVKNINSTMNCMVRFNCCMGYQLGFSLLDFFPSLQLWSSWKVWGSSPVLSLVSDGLPYILYFHLYVLFDGEVV